MNKKTTAYERVNSLFSKYGNIGYVKNLYFHDGVLSDYSRILHGALDQPKWGAFTIGIILKDKNGNDLEQKELIFDSQNKAADLCKDLGQGMDNYDANPDIGPDTYTGRSLIARDSNGYQRVFMVPYTIDYDTGSQQKRDGTSTKAKKYVMCPNYTRNGWLLDPRNNNENEETGIVSGVLNKDKTEYTVTCMPNANKPAATFRRKVVIRGQTSAGDIATWINEITNTSTYTPSGKEPANLHEFNKFFGATYCPVSPA